MKLDVKKPDKSMEKERRMKIECKRLEKLWNQEEEDWR